MAIKTFVFASRICPISRAKKKYACGDKPCLYGRPGHCNLWRESKESDCYITSKSDAVMKEFNKKHKRRK